LHKALKHKAPSDSRDKCGQECGQDPATRYGPGKQYGGDVKVINQTQAPVQRIIAGHDESPWSYLGLHVVQAMWNKDEEPPVQADTAAAEVAARLAAPHRHPRGIIVVCLDGEES